MRVPKRTEKIKLINLSDGQTFYVDPLTLCESKKIVVQPC